MTRSELTIAIAAGLFAAIVLGWTLRWLYQLLTRVPPPPALSETELGQALEEAQEARDAALAERAEIEREASGQIAQLRAELDATMDGLRAARHQIADLEAQLERSENAPTG